MTTIKAGQMRTWITIQQRVQSQDAAGQPSRSWIAWQQVWARVVSVTGSENFKGMQFSPETTHQVTIRWLDGLTPLNRIVVPLDGKILDIISVNYGERRLDDTVIITCKERISQGGDLDVG